MAAYTRPHSMPTEGEIREAVVRRYGSLERPDFAFLQEAIDAGAWNELVARLASEIQLHETTDLNNDHCRSFELMRTERRLAGLMRTERSWATLQSSLIGPYAVFFGHDNPPKRELFITTDDAGATACERFVIDCLRELGVALLGLEILRLPIPLALFDTAPERTRIYQALFSDNDYIPGEFEGLW